ncbi:hypothetical protein E2562_006746 [Oryza meyeriana var. granulata]|uniref:Uncharacterized protein n=1 Tax=Oryza meyeriana var. granulata TaxID=110450 RepID=A0A6G1EG50_9ORYZ|nr:hypothetical protein E2562_031319 [Oryza meyeriana var. granulata]KAF0923790.1 hypothetical protein E2562_006746 [Oryza meyeriana var. granulata]
MAPHGGCKGHVRDEGVLGAEGGVLEHGCDDVSASGAAQENAALVSGYSKNLVRLFLDGNLTSAAVMGSWLMPSPS